jgi:tetratricopeptide (TPR) repeat protein
MEDLGDPVESGPGKFGRFSDLKLIGSGGMGRVYSAFDPQLGRTLAIKRTVGVEAEQRIRFFAEARAQAALDHPNICKIYEVGETEGEPYIAMQWVRGKGLQDAGKAMTLGEKVAIMRDVAHAIQAAHRAGLVHRDIKPSNILVERDDRGGWHPYVVDFGLARLQSQPGITLSGMVVGSPCYMSPEQAAGEGSRVTELSDVYGLGATLYELLTGHLPFSGANPAEMLWKVMQGEPVPPRHHLPDLPRDLETIVLRCMERDPERRYPSASQLAEDLDRYLQGEPIQARPASLIYRLRKRLSKHYRLSVAILLACLLTLSLTLAFLPGRPAPEGQQGPAPSEADRHLILLPIETAPDLAYCSDGFVDGLYRRLVDMPGFRVLAPRQVSADLLPQAWRLHSRLAEMEGQWSLAVHLQQAGAPASWRQEFHSSEGLEALERVLASELELHLLQGSDAKRISDSEELRPATQANQNAYHAYLKGKHLWNQFTIPGWEEALHHFLEAIQWDPDYTLAYCGLANTHTMLGLYGENQAASFTKALEAAQRACAMDRDLGEAHTSLGIVILFYQHRWLEAEKSLRHGVALNPSSATAHHGLGVMLCLSGSLAEGLQVLAHAQDLDPLSTVIAVDLAWAHQLRWELDAANQILQAAVKLDPQSPLVWLEIYYHLDLVGKDAEAIAAYGKFLRFSGQEESALIPLQQQLSEQGVMAYLEARAALEEAAGVARLHKARTHVRLGQFSAALDQLDLALQEGEPTLIYAATSNGLRALHEEERFGALLKSLGLPRTLPEVMLKPP